MNSCSLPIFTQRLLLRTFAETDLDALNAYYTLPSLRRYLDRPARDLADTKLALQAMRRQYRLNRPGDAFTLAVIRIEDDALLGHVSFLWTDATAAQAELRFVFNPRYTGHGYAGEAVRVAMDYGFDSFGFHRIFARCSAANQPAVRLLKGLDMRLEAHFREHALYHGDWDEELHFAILDREWRRDNKVKDIQWHRVA